MIALPVPQCHTVSHSTTSERGCQREVTQAQRAVRGALLPQHRLLSASAIILFVCFVYLRLCMQQPVCCKLHLRPSQIEMHHSECDDDPFYVRLVLPAVRWGCCELSVGTSDDCGHPCGHHPVKLNKSGMLFSLPVMHASDPCKLDVSWYCSPHAPAFFLEAGGMCSMAALPAHSCPTLSLHHRLQQRRGHVSLSNLARVQLTPASSRLEECYEQSGLCSKNVTFSTRGMPAALFTATWGVHNVAYRLHAIRQLAVEAAGSLKALLIPTKY